MDASSPAKPFNCDSEGCEKSFSLAHQLKRHLGVHEKPAKVPKVKSSKPASPKRTLRCHELGCGFECDSRAALGKHMRSVHVGPKVAKQSCPEVHRCSEEGCGKTFSRKYALQKHVETVHLDIRPFECRICQSSFGHNHLLTRHLKSCHGEDRSDAEAEVEVQEQPDDNPADAASIIAGLSGLTYEAERPFACSNCRLRFFRQYDLDRHRC